MATSEDFLNTSEAKKVLADTEAASLVDDEQGKLFKRIFNFTEFGTLEQKLFLTKKLMVLFSRIPITHKKLAEKLIKEYLDKFPVSESENEIVKVDPIQNLMEIDLSSPQLKIFERMDEEELLGILKNRPAKIVINSGIHTRPKNSEKIESILGREVDPRKNITISVLNEKGEEVKTNLREMGQDYLLYEAFELTLLNNEKLYDPKTLKLKNPFKKVENAGYKPPKLTREILNDLVEKSNDFINQFQLAKTLPVGFSSVYKENPEVVPCYTCQGLIKGIRQECSTCGLQAHIECLRVDFTPILRQGLRCQYCPKLEGKTVKNIIRRIKLRIKLGERMLAAPFYKCNVHPPIENYPDGFNFPEFWMKSKFPELVKKFEEGEDEKSIAD